MSSIFVQISSLNDKEFYKTIEDCINKSSGENDIYFGLHECYVENKTEFNFKNINIKYSKAPENLGIGMGRYIANEFYNNEDYYMQVDAHSRFVKNWDLLLINNLINYIDNGISCVLTTYPMRYWYENGIEVLEEGNSVSNIRVVKNESLFFEHRVLNQEAGGDLETKCAESISGGFVFGPGDIAKIKHHPGIFYGEEMIRAASFYTNGYNLMIPENNVIYHLYGSDSDRVAPWTLYPEEFKFGMEFSKNTIKKILSNNIISAVGIGSKRPLEQYGRYIGVDFKTGKWL